jgi:hypothetical protein
MPKFLTDIQFIATSSMDTPSTGFATLYLNTDGYLYVKFPNGSESKLHVGS